MANIPKISALAGSVVLAITAIFHLLGFPDASRIANDPATDLFAAIVIQPLWVFPAITWAVLAVLNGVLARNPPVNYKVLLSASLAILIAHALTMFVFMGPFFGAFLLVLVVLLYLPSLVLQNNGSDEG